MLNAKNILILKDLLWMLVIVAVVFVSSAQFIDQYIVPKWIAFTVAISMLCVVNALKIIFGAAETSISVFPDMQDMQVIVAVVASVLSVYGILQYIGISFGISGMQVTGSYDNPAGFAATLSSSLPLIALGMRHKKRFLRTLHSLAFILSSFAILFSGSRAGYVCLGVVYLFFINNLLIRKHWLKWSMIIVWFIFLICQMIDKTGSAAGRILIWTCCFRMLEDRSLFGFGRGGFEANYMDYQAKYFINNPDSPLAIYADSVQYPFNEFLNILIDYGMLVLAIIVLFLGYMFYRYFRNRTLERLTALMCIVVVSVFAMFSYPLMYPFVWIMLIYGCAVLLSDMDVKWPLRLWMKKTVAVVVLGLCIYSGYRIYIWTNAEMRWTRTAKIQVYTDECISEYDNLYAVLSNDRYFMYNYSYALYRSGDYLKAHQMASECSKLWADYDLELLLGTLSDKLGMFDEAISHYTLASDMCPNRFKPLYFLMQLYDKSGMSDKALKYAQKINRKSIKIPSAEIVRMKREAEEYVQQINH